MITISIPVREVKQRKGTPRLYDREYIDRNIGNSSVRVCAEGGHSILCATERDVLPVHNSNGIPIHIVIYIYLFLSTYLYLLIYIYLFRVASTIVPVLPTLESDLG